MYIVINLYTKVHFQTVTFRRGKRKKSVHNCPHCPHSAFRHLPLTENLPTLKGKFHVPSPSHSSR